jgi:DNA (cytosine-5)-methyltransferase 1
MIRFASFFAGIGGFDLGFERAGMQTAFQCEIDPFCQQILKRHWPTVPIHDDITTLTASAIPTTDLWCAGWPCQDLSHANTDRKGLAGERSGLFYTFMELVAEAQPTWLVLENVPGLLSAEQGTALETVVNTLEANGYLGGWISCDAADAGLPHHRDRVFFIGSFRSDRAYQFFANSRELYWDLAAGESRKTKARSKVRHGTLPDAPLVVQRRGGFGYTMATSICPTLRAQTGGHQGGHSDRPILCGEKLDMDRVGKPHGVPPRLDGRRGRLLGNAVVPRIAEWIGRRILTIEEDYRTRSMVHSHDL